MNQTLTPQASTTITFTHFTEDGKEIRYPSICPAKECASSLLPGKKFCLDCGTKIEGIIIEKESPKVTKCLNCAVYLIPGKKFCLECGTKVGETGPAGVPTPPESRDSTPSRTPGGVDISLMSPRERARMVEERDRASRRVCYFGVFFLFDFQSPYSDFQPHPQNHHPKLRIAVKRKRY